MYLLFILTLIFKLFYCTVLRFLMMADTCDVRSVLLEIIGRKVFNCIKYGGEDALTNFIGYFSITFC